MTKPPATPRPAPAPAPSARRKIRTLKELGRIAANLRRRGERVVLAHGVFDLLHLGHVRHLEAARRQGTVLIVTVTDDAHVNKGPGRPVFSDHMRAETLASLEYVDWVGISHEASSVPVLETIRPDIYVKGDEYANPDDDVTGKIVGEREAVESVGGALVFTDDISFSSSNLINRHFDVYEPSVQQHLDEMRRGGALERILDLIEKLRDYRVLVVGDAIVDEYRYVKPMGKSQKEEIIASRYESEESFAGGVIAAANHIASFCREVEVVTCLGNDEADGGVSRRSLADNVTLSPVYREDGPTTRKSRFIDHSYSMRKLFEIYFMDDSPLPRRTQAKVDRIIAKRAAGADLVVVTDFGHGLIAASTVRTLVDKARFLAVNTQTNSANYGFNLITRYPRADFVCLDGPETRLAVADKYSDLETLVGKKLPASIDCRNFIVTTGTQGCYAFTPDDGIVRLPALTNKIVDTMGAGDAFFAVAAPTVVAGAAIRDAAFIGNMAGALKVGIVGHRASIARATLIKALTALLK